MCSSWQVKKYQDVWITSGPLWLPVEEPPTEENAKEQSDKVVDLSTEDEPKKKRKVRPPRPPARRMNYPVIGPNQVSVPTHLYKVHRRSNQVKFQIISIPGDCGVWSLSACPSTCSICCSQPTCPEPASHRISGYLSDLKCYINHIGYCVMGSYLKPVVWM